MTTFGIKLHVWGEYACFTRPELKSERMSYEVMTPSAARGVLTAIYWKPQFEWVVDRIRVLKPIRMVQVRRNELENKMVVPSVDVMMGKKTAILGCEIEKNRQQRSATVLRDVGYIIEAHVKVLEEIDGVNSIAKHLEMFKRRARCGQCFHQPYFGNREFPVMFELVEEDAVVHDMLPAEQRNRAFGLMLHDLVYTPDPKNGRIICGHTGRKLSATPHFFMAELRDGVLVIPPINQTMS